MDYWTKATALPFYFVLRTSLYAWARLASY